MIPMTDKAVLAIAAGLVVLAVVLMASMHERHYRSRRNVILEANLDGLHSRVSAIESILREDRLT
jgi:hypothetical protein